MKGIVSGGVKLKHLLNLWSLSEVYVYPTCFWIIGIANRSPTRPYAISDFLSQSSLNILSQIIYKIFTLAKGNVEHEQTLRCWLKPKSGKFEGLNQAAINEMNYLSAIHAISCKTIRVPRN